MGKVFGALTAGIVIFISPYIDSSAVADTLSDKQINQRLAGNTIQFNNQKSNAKTYLFFGQEGKISGIAESDQARSISQKWWVTKNNLLCRKLPKKSQPVCTNIIDQGENFLVFKRPNGSVLLEARLLEGNQLSKKTATNIQQTGAIQGSGKSQGKPEPEVVIKRLDKDGDGQLSSKEFKGPKQKFAHIDADQDGFLTLEELTEAKQSKAETKPSAKTQNSQKPTAEKIFSKLDVNGDSKVDLKDFNNNKKKFNRFDTNGDGSITIAEVEKLVSKEDSKPEFMTSFKRVVARSYQTPRRSEPRNCKTEKTVTQLGHLEIESISPDCVFPGTVLFADTTKKTFPRFVEIDMSGKVVWSYNFSNSGIPNLMKNIPNDPSRLANGNTLFFSKNYAAIEIDPTGKVVWKHLDNRVSHDVDRLPNGNTIYVRSWTNKGEDQIREVDPDGNIVWSWNGLADFGGPEYNPVKPNKHGYPGVANDDGWIHTNAVTRLSDGTTVVSLYFFNQVVYLDKGGNLIKSIVMPGAHDPEVLENGNLLAAINTNNPGIIEFSGQKPVWIWDIKKTPLKGNTSELYATRDVNRLPNGNTFITTANRLLEIDAAGEILWQLRSKVQVNENYKPFYKAFRIGVDGSVYGG